jgi:hypothetical protein
MALIRRVCVVWVGQLGRTSIGAVGRSASGGGDGERVKGANYFNEGEDPALKADTEVGACIRVWVAHLCMHAHRFGPHMLRPLHSQSARARWPTVVKNIFRLQCMLRARGQPAQKRCIRGVRVLGLWKSDCGHIQHMYGPTATCCVQGSPRVSVALNRSRKIDDRVVLRWYVLMNLVGEGWPQEFASIGQPYVPYAGGSDTAFNCSLFVMNTHADVQRSAGSVATEPVTTMLNHSRSHVICVASGRALFRCTFVQGVHGFANVTGIVAPSIICSHILPRPCLSCTHAVP